MDYYNVTRINSQMATDINLLLTVCQSDCSYQILSFTDNDYNIFPDLPCFFLSYYNETLIGFLSLFVPNNEECELYSFIHPSYRNQGIFTHLLDMALVIIEKYNIRQMLVPVTPDNRVAALVLESMEFEKYYSEYTLIYQASNRINHNIPVHIMSDQLVLLDKNMSYTLYLKDNLIGSCHIDDTGESFTIYSFEILPGYRQAGYGSYLLDRIIIDLQSKNSSKNILLQVSGENPVAYNMYLRHNFSILSQIDYWVY